MNEEKNKNTDGEIDDILEQLTQKRKKPEENAEKAHSTQGVQDGSLLPKRSKSFDDIVANINKEESPQKSTASKNAEATPEVKKPVQAQPTRNSAKDEQNKPFSHPLVNGGESQPSLEESIRISEQKGEVLKKINTGATPQQAKVSEKKTDVSKSTASVNTESKESKQPEAPKTEAPKSATPKRADNKNGENKADDSAKNNAGSSSANGKKDVMIDSADTGDDLVVCNDADEKPRLRDTAFAGVIKMLVYIVLVLVVSFSIAQFVINAGNDIFALQKGDYVEAVVDIPEGASVSEIAKILKDNKIINSELAFEYYAEFKSFKKQKAAEEDAQKEDKATTVNTQTQVSDASAEGSESSVTALINKVFSYAFGFLDYLGSERSFEYNKGEYRLENTMPYDKIISEITETRKERFVIKVTIPEGYTTDEILDLFAKSGIETPREELIDAINNYEYDYEFVKQLTDAGIPKNRTYRLDGYLFPDTYNFYNDENAVAIIDKLLSNFNNKFDASYFDRATSLGFSVDDIVNLAALIEKEAKVPTEQLFVSSVFHNRIKTGDPSRLESCATIQYIYQLVYGERKARILDSDTAIEHPYNTYKNKGLPPGAIANPGLNAIIAALYPEETDFKYFVATKNGTTIFSKTYEEHLRNKEKAESEYGTNE